MALKRRSILKTSDPVKNDENSTNEMIVIKNLKPQTKPLLLIDPPLSQPDEALFYRPKDNPTIKFKPQNSNVITEPLILTAEASREIDIVTNLIESTNAIETLAAGQMDSKYLPSTAGNKTLTLSYESDKIVKMSQST